MTKKGTRNVPLLSGLATFSCDDRDRHPLHCRAPLGAQAVYDRINERLVGRSVRSCQGRPLAERSRFEWLSAKLRITRRRRALAEKGFLTLRSGGRVRQDTGQIWAKLAGTFAGIGVRGARWLRVGDFGVRVVGKPGTRLFFGSVLAAEAGGFVGGRVSQAILTWSPDPCGTRAADHLATARPPPQITISGATGAFSTTGTARKPHVAWRSVLFPLSRHT